jgi:Protein of unknown function (DUF3644)
MKLRTGKAKRTLEASIDSALLAVEIYNKPRTTFRSAAFISLMIMAWTRLFHAYFHARRIEYTYKTGTEIRYLELAKCIEKYSGELSAALKANLKFFIELRNKVEHRYIDNREIDNLIFGECQALLYNFESLLIDLFGNEYSINESLVYSLQFSKLRTKGQLKAVKSIQSRELSELTSFVSDFRRDLDMDVYGSQEFSVKLIQIPKISNTSKNDAAIEFVRWDEVDENDRAAYEQIAVLIKEKKVVVEAANVKRLKPSDVWKRVNAMLGEQIITSNLHVILYKLFSVRPIKGAPHPADTNQEFCLYDETHRDYVYLEAWVNFLVHFFQTKGFTADKLREMERQNEKLDIEKFKV